jgi:hypothetical protein
MGNDNYDTTIDPPSVTEPVAVMQEANIYRNPPPRWWVGGRIHRN